MTSLLRRLEDVIVRAVERGVRAMVPEDEAYHRGYCDAKEDCRVLCERAARLDHQLETWHR